MASPILSAENNRRGAYGTIPQHQHQGGSSNDDHNHNDQDETSASYDYGHFITTSTGAGTRRRPSYAASLRSSVRSSVRSLVSASFVLEGKRCSVRDLGGDATIVSEVFNIAKNLVGGGGRFFDAAF